MHEFIRLGLCLSLAGLLAVHGLKKRSLSQTGALAAFIVGAVHFYQGLQPSAVMLLFYLSSSKLTKFKSKVKAKIEHDFREGGQRTAVQVFANTLGGVLSCALLAVTAQPQLRGALLSAFLAHYAAACSDTWSSELGILSSGQPRLILNGKVVPKGTNGGVSALGLGAGIAGGAFMGISYWLAGAIDTSWSLQPASLTRSLSAGIIFGAVGTLLDSLIGALLQTSTLMTATGTVASRPAEDGQLGQHVSGMNLLTNDAVNLIALNTTAILAAVTMPL